MMHAEADSKALKRGALDLLASGNSVAAVSEILRLPADEVLAWAQQGREVDAASPILKRADEVPKTSADDPRRGAPIEPTGFIPQRLVTRVIFVSLPIGLAALALYSNLGSTLRQLDLLWVYRISWALCLLIGACSILYGLRSGFEITGHGVVFHNAISRREIAYADIDSYAVTKNPQLGAYVLKLNPKLDAQSVRAWRELWPGASTLQIWLEPELVQGGIAGWLRSMHCVGYTFISPRGTPYDSDQVRDEWNALLDARSSALRI